RLPEAVRNHYQAGSRGGPPRHGNVLNSVDPGRRAVTCLRTELSSFVCNESSPQGRHTDHRSGTWLQKVERVSHPKASAFEIGRAGRSCLAAGVPSLGNRDVSELSSEERAIGIVSSCVTKAALLGPFLRNSSSSELFC